MNYVVDFLGYWAEVGNGNNCAWNAGVNIVLKVLGDVDVEATLSIWSRNALYEEERMDDIGCANWSWVNKVGGRFSIIFHYLILIANSFFPIIHRLYSISNYLCNRLIPRGFRINFWFGFCFLFPLIINQTSSFAFISTNIPFSTILVINRNSNSDNSTVSFIGIAEIDELFPLYVRTGPSSVVDSVTSSPMLLLQTAAANISIPEKSLPSPISSFVASEECWLSTSCSESS